MSFISPILLQWTERFSVKYLLHKCAGKALNYLKKLGGQGLLEDQNLKIFSNLSPIPQQTKPQGEGGYHPKRAENHKISGDFFFFLQKYSIRWVLRDFTETAENGGTVLLNLKQAEH